MTYLVKIVIAFLFFLFDGLFLFAGVIDMPAAKMVAINYFNLHTAYHISNTDIATIYTASTGNLPDYYIFNINNNHGFIIVAANNNVKPVLGYSTKGKYDTNSIPPEFAYLMDTYKKQISYIRFHSIIATSSIQAEWERYLINGNVKYDRYASHIKTVLPLLSTSWNQSPYYNAYCPGASQNKAVAGCVATAMAQIMKYWSYPPNGVGSFSYEDAPYGILTVNFDTTYNWSEMPTKITNENNSVALLMYDIGVSVATAYSPSESNAWVIKSDNSICAESSFVSYFGYNAYTIQGLRRKHYLDSIWIELVKNELDNARPVIYAGTGIDGGHTWVCDGYDMDTNFHMNWGWGGSCDGYYTLNSLNPNILLDSDQEAIIGIQPSSEIIPSLNSTVVIFPNPNRGNVTIILQTKEQQCELEMINMSGQVVASYMVNSGINQINLGYLHGIFIYRVDKLNGSQFAKGKLIIE